MSLKEMRGVRLNDSKLKSLGVSDATGGTVSAIACADGRDVKEPADPKVSTDKRGERTAWLVRPANANLGGSLRTV